MQLILLGYGLFFFVISLRGLIHGGIEFEFVAKKNIGAEYTSWHIMGFWGVLLCIVVMLASLWLMYVPFMVEINRFISKLVSKRRGGTGTQK